MTTRKELNALLRDVYYDPSHPAGFAGVDAVHKEAKKKFPNLRRQDVRAWLEHQDVYTLHKPSRRRYPRNRVVVYGIDDQWQADLVDLAAYARYNKGTKFLLTCIDVFSKYAWVIPLKDKSGKSLLAAFRKLFRESGRLPDKLQTDKGTEFYNARVKEFLKSKGVKLFSTENETKASVVERFNRTLKTKMWRYFTANATYNYSDVLQDFVSAYNGARHRSIGRPPDTVTENNELEVWKTLYGRRRRDRTPKSSQLRPGDHVRLSMVTRPFRKGYLPRWTEEVFTVDRVISRRPFVYAVKDWDGEPVEGTFYGEELQKIGEKDDDAFYKIEKVLKKRMRSGKPEYLVKWFGYPEKFNSWVRDVVKL